MTATPYDTTDDPAPAFIRALPRHLLARTHHTARIPALVRAAVANGWTIDALVHEATRNLDGIANPGGLITHRLQQATHTTPPAPASSPFRPVPFCTPACEERRGWIENDNGEPIDRCPCRSTP
jgi:hypothetical protein